MRWVLNSTRAGRQQRPPGSTPSWRGQSVLGTTSTPSQNMTPVCLCPPGLAVPPQEAQDGAHLAEPQHHHPQSPPQIQLPGSSWWQLDEDYQGMRQHLGGDRVRQGDPTGGVGGWRRLGLAQLEGLNLPLPAVGALPAPRLPAQAASLEGVFLHRQHPQFQRDDRQPWKPAGQRRDFPQG